MTPIEIKATHRERAQMSTKHVDLCGVSMHAGWLECMKGTRGGYVEKKLVLNCIFRCGQIHNSQSYQFSHTLLCYLSRTWMFNKPISGKRLGEYRGLFIEQKPMLSSNFRGDQIHNCHRYDLGYTLLRYLSQT
jgi:hypothetical protein